MEQYRRKRRLKSFFQGLFNFTLIMILATIMFFSSSDLFKAKESYKMREAVTDQILSSCSTTIDKEGHVVTECSERKEILYFEDPEALIDVLDNF